MTKFCHIRAVIKPRSLNNEGIFMDLEREAIRLSAMIALCVGAFVIMWSIDEFHQQQLPTQIGDAQCTWWSATVQGC